jgi:mRNA-degrading endonuclease RelE of RelBE toxin-antitoxin system
VPYRVEFAESVEAQFKALPTRDRATILASIDRQLLEEPLKETRNRKPLRPNPIAPWELRVGELRVFYEAVEPVEGDDGVVRVLAVGRKRRNVLTIGGKEIRL